jgi:monofunctional biosynthetic peptidoglycan transglycosylase
MSYLVSAPRSLRVGAAASLCAAGIAACAFYLALPDVRPLARSFPRTTGLIELRVREGLPRDRVRYAPVPLDRISPHLVRAVLVAEDASFYRHRGVDWVELRDAVRDALARRRPLRGASTLTQQLARTLYLSPARHLGRKLAEFAIARRLERALGKRRILELYLSAVEWGPGLFGAEAAARAYFGVSASDLDPAQAAMLAATLPQPLTANPARNPERLRWRAGLILRRMGVATAPPEAPTDTLGPVPEMAPASADSPTGGAADAADTVPTSEPGGAP